MLDNVENNPLFYGATPLIKEKCVSNPEMSSTEKKFINFININIFRVLFNRFTKAQIDSVNETGQLPENAKFVKDEFGSYTIINDFLSLTLGTHELPTGYELKKDILGFTVVTPIKEKSLLIEDNQLVS